MGEAASIFRHSGFATTLAMLNHVQLQHIDASLNDAARHPAGLRQMLEHDWCRHLGASLRNQLISLGLIQPDYVGVQCTYFEKSAEHNWLVAFHQDLSIPVKYRVDHPALAGWSAKDGTLFVQPPRQVLEKLVALRLHIDECGAEDGALKVVPGSHRAGRICDPDKAKLRNELGEVLCPVAIGGAMVMSPLLLHASSKATGQSHRRVLHFLFGPSELPFGLSWANQIPEVTQR